MQSGGDLGRGTASGARGEKSAETAFTKFRLTGGRKRDLVTQSIKKRNLGQGTSVEERKQNTV